MAIERQGPQDLIETTTTQDAEEDSQIIDVIGYMQGKGVVHRDLKLENILIGNAKEIPNSESSLYNIKLVDFGFANKYVKEIPVGPAPTIIYFIIII